MWPPAAMLDSTTLLFAFERKKQKEGKRKRKTLELQAHDLRDEGNFKRSNLVCSEESKVVLSPFYR